MAEDEFRALVVREVEPKRFERKIEVRRIDELPPGELTVRVHHSSLNYKDALSASGNRGVTRAYPHTPGIDAAGEVVRSDSPELSPGDEVVVIGYDLGMNTPGGFGEYVRVPADWAAALPETLSTKEAMIYGTAGFTAAMCVDKIVSHGVDPNGGEVLVTGATGGVGSMAVALLSHLGYQVVAATGKKHDAGNYLRDLGATSVVAREDVTDDSDKPMLRSRWSAVVDAVGGAMLASALKATQRNAAVAICGLVASPELATTVLPFILRGVTLYGIDSASYPIEQRRRLWQRLGGPWKVPNLDGMARAVTLDELEPEIDRILSGGQIGRVLVSMRSP